MNPASVGETYWQLYQQPRDAWTFEQEIRPFRRKVVMSWQAKLNSISTSAVPTRT